MDLGMLGLDGLVGSSDGSFVTSDPETKLKWYGSGCLKQDRSDQDDGDDDDVDDWRRSFKVAKTSATSTIADDYFSAPKAMLLHHQQQQQKRGSLLRSNTTLLCDGQQMLSFSSVPTSSQTVAFPYYNHSSTAYGRNVTGYGSGGLNVLSGVRDPFTPAQWMELEHQALIYKYITSNVPVPSNLLLPIKKALESAAFRSFSGTSFGPTTWGWGGFRLGFSGTADPEPGRCRRTDGKKWRCSRDAVPDQKYCERHMNRGRHRSRKPVEGQTGHSVSGPTTTPAAKLMPMASSASATLVPGGGASNSLGLSHNPQLKNLQPCASSPNLHRISQNKENLGERTQDVKNLSMLSPAIDLKENQFSIPTRAEFGSVCSDYLLNPLHRNSSLINCRNYGSSEDLHSREKDPQNSVHQFMDDWPKTQTDNHRSAISWPRLDLQPDRTQLSISIPASAASDFMSSSTSSPANDQKLALSPLRLSREELDSTQMGLGVGSAAADEPNQRQANWIPISWETSMGGPLGEALHNSNANNSSTVECRSSLSALNLMNDNSWEGSPRLASSSPTGVLQRMTFGSFSNSSAGSSPRVENNNSPHVGAGLCSDLGSTLVNSGSLAAL